MGGAAGLERVRVLRFDFAVDRDGERVAIYSHWWDRQTGDYRLEGRTREEGTPYRVLFNLGTRDGSVRLGEEMLEGEAAAEHVERAYARFINDSYWLLMPWKWLDPGVELIHEGEREIGGVTHDVVRLSFAAGIGLTSNDRYWGLVSRESGLMTRWEYVLQTEDGQPGEGPPAVWTWTDWTDPGAGILLSRTRVRQGEGPAVTIHFPTLEAHADLSDAEARKLLHPAD